LETRPNYQTLIFEYNDPRNDIGETVVLYCDNDAHTLNDKAIIVCYYQNKWHQVERINEKTILGKHLPEVDKHNYDDLVEVENPSLENNSSGEENPQEKVNQQIRNSPIAQQVPLISIP
jgi:hypothetical protein